MSAGREFQVFFLQVTTILDIYKLVITFKEIMICQSVIIIISIIITTFVVHLLRTTDENIGASQKGLK